MATKTGKTTQFTPGPWTTGSGNVSVIKAGRGARAFAVAEAAPPTQRNGLSSTETFANAKLIAAAPDMRAQLVAILNTCEAGEGYSAEQLLANIAKGIRSTLAAIDGSES